MKVLGISPLDKDATVSFVEDGRVVFACGEERLSRVKLQDGFPFRALELGFQSTGWAPDEIEVATYAFLDAAGETAAMRRAMEQDAQNDDLAPLARSARALRKALSAKSIAEKSLPCDTAPIPGLAADGEFMLRKPWWKRAVYDAAALHPRLDRAMHRRAFRQWVRDASADHELRTRQLEEGLQKYGLCGKLQRINHHRAHAANAFYSSGFSRALALSLDGYGTGNCGAVYACDASGLKLLHAFRFPYSLGIFYEQVTSALGFTAGKHEGKIVGLAAYGDPEILAPVLRERFSAGERGEIVMHGALNYFFTRMLAQHFAKRDVAAAYQRVLEEAAQRVVRYWVRKTNCPRVVVSGGVHANVKLNQRLREIDEVEAVFVYPNMGDGGCATGAALLAFDSETLRSASIAGVYYGPEYSDEAIAQALDDAGLAYEPCDDVEAEVARLLAENRIVARFHGRMEYGPRALGNRSILYPAHDPQVNLWLNHQLGRTEFMPFAPACLAEEASRLFHHLEGCEKTAEFMTITFDCTDEMKQKCPAAVHIDGTARPQLVSRRSNASFHKILRYYHERTGVPAVINTSFNMHEEPIVCSPNDAIRAFVKGRLDYLAIGPYLAPHPQLSVIAQERAAPAYS